MYRFPYSTFTVINNVINYTTDIYFEETNHMKIDFRLTLEEIRMHFLHFTNVKYLKTNPLSVLK